MTGMIKSQLVTSSPTSGLHDVYNRMPFDEFLRSRRFTDDNYYLNVLDKLENMLEIEFTARGPWLSGSFCSEMMRKGSDTLFRSVPNLCAYVDRSVAIGGLQKGFEMSWLKGGMTGRAFDDIDIFTSSTQQYNKLLNALDRRLLGAVQWKWKNRLLIRKRMREKESLSWKSETPVRFGSRTFDVIRTISAPRVVRYDFFSRHGGKLGAAQQRLAADINQLLMKLGIDSRVYVPNGVVSTSVSSNLFIDAPFAKTMHPQWRAEIETLRQRYYEVDALQHFSVQLIGFCVCDGIEQLLDNFDFDCVQVGYDGKDVVYTNGALWAALTGQSSVRCDAIADTYKKGKWLSVQRRFFKYRRFPKGYGFSKEDEQRVELEAACDVESLASRYSLSF